MAPMIDGERRAGRAGGNAMRTVAARVQSTIRRVYRERGYNPYNSADVAMSERAGYIYSLKLADDYRRLDAKIAKGYR